MAWRGWKRNLGIAVVVGVAAATAFLVPTIWGKPWFIEHLYARVLLEYVLQRPMLLSQLRILEPWGLDFHSDELGDFSVEFTRETAQQLAESLEILRSYDRADQSAEQRLSTDVLEWFLSVQVEGEPFLFHGYPVNQMNGFQSTLPDFMLNVHQLNDERDAENYVERLSLFGTAMDQTIETLRYQESLGIVPPRFVVERVLDEVRGFVEPPPSEHVLYTHLVDGLEAIDALDEPARRRLGAAARARLEETVYPAYARLEFQLEHMERVAGEADGVWALPDGDAYYAWALRWHTSTDLSADEIHRIGLAEVERIQGEIRDILRSEGLDADDWVASIEALRRDERFVFPDDDAGRRQILAEYQQIVDAASARLPELFGILPRAPVVVERVPEFKEQGSAAAYYQPPPFDGSKPGVFYANLRDVGDVAAFRMRTLAYHEAVPGHHLQIAVAQELEDVPFFRRVLPFTAFVEGWALYAERLAAEEGFLPTPYDRLGQLMDEVFRAVRLVVDTGIHAKRWSRERAIEYMVANTGMPRGEVVAEIERYVVLPGQACAYKVGQLQILALRERARRALGERFDLRTFHDVVLGGGALPIEILERVVDDWIASQR